MLSHLEGLDHEHVLGVIVNMPEGSKTPRGGRESSPLRSPYGVPLSYEVGTFQAAPPHVTYGDEGGSSKAVEMRSFLGDEDPSSSNQHGAGRRGDKVTARALPTFNMERVLVIARNILIEYSQSP